MSVIRNTGLPRTGRILVDGELEMRDPISPFTYCEKDIVMLEVWYRFPLRNL